MLGLWNWKKDLKGRSLSGSGHKAHASCVFLNNAAGNAQTKSCSIFLGAEKGRHDLLLDNLLHPLSIRIEQACILI